MLGLARPAAAQTKAVRPTTELVIEGFPRSGNSFAVPAIELSQVGPIRLAHHSHAPAEVIRAVTWRVPCLVVVRPAPDAVESMLQRSPKLSPPTALASWIRFYESLQSHLDGAVVATFDQATGDFGAVVDRVNERFGTSFNRYEHTEENVAACCARSAAAASRTWRPTASADLSTGRPSETRMRLRNRVRERMDASLNEDRLAQARDLYSALERRSR